MGKTYAFLGNELVGAAIGKRLEDAGYSAVPAADAAVVLTYFTTATALEDAYFDESGLVQSALPDAMLIDLSPSTPSCARELNAVATVSDLVCVEAPLVVADITAPHAFSDASNLVAFAAGEEGAVAKALPVLELIAGSVQQTGAVGSAQLARAAYTLQTTAQVCSAIEADALYGAIQRSSNAFEGLPKQVGATTPHSESVLAAVRAKRFEGDFTIEMFMAELSAALMAADDVDLILPQAEASLHLLELLAVIGGADKSPAALSLVYGDEASCAEAGLDWTRAEQAYGEAEEADADDEGYGDYDYDDEYDGFGQRNDGLGFGTYSAN